MNRIYTMEEQQAALDKLAAVLTKRGVEVGSPASKVGEPELLNLPVGYYEVVFVMDGYDVFGVDSMLGVSMSLSEVVERLTQEKTNG